MDLVRKSWVKQSILSVRTGGNTFKVQVSAGLFGVRCLTMSSASTLQLSPSTATGVEQLGALSYDLKSYFKSLLVFLLS